MDVHEDQLGGSVIGNEALDRFPEGMQVLAVDDSPVCLKTLEITLRQCHYEVTTAKNALEARDILKKYRNKFDLIIIDVQMPDMDGFHLLQLLRNETDLPVIMVSSDVDTDLIKKGISYGACCYLEKPVQLEVSKTIWQHVFQRKRFNFKDQCKTFDEQGISLTCTSDQKGKGNSKRKEHDEYSDDVERSTKKQRVISSQDEEPTKTSDQKGNCKSIRKEHDEHSDDVERSTKKYRVISSQERQSGEKTQTEEESEDEESSTKSRMYWSFELHKKFIEAYNSLPRKDAVPTTILKIMKEEGLTRSQVASHLQKYKNSLKNSESEQPDRRRNNAYGDVHSATPFSSHIPLHMLPSSDFSATFSMPRNVYSPPMQSVPFQNVRNSFNNVSNLQPSVITNQSRNLSATSRTPAEVNKLQQRNSMIGIRQSARIPYETLPGSSIHDDWSTLMLQGNPQKKNEEQIVGNQSSLNSLSPNLFDNGSQILNGHDESWKNGVQGGVQVSEFPSNTVYTTEASIHGQVPPENLGVSSCAFSAPVEEIREDIHVQSQGCDVQDIFYTSKQQWADQKQDYYDSLNPPSIISTSSVVHPLGKSLDLNDVVCSISLVSSLSEQPNGSDTTVPLCVEVESYTVHAKVDPDNDFLLEPAKSDDGIIQNDFESLINQGANENAYDILDAGFQFDAVQDKQD